MDNILPKIKAPELNTEYWINSISPITIEKSIGIPIVLHSFQMLCPGCILHGLPQVNRLFEYYKKNEVLIIGIHTVFEHHRAMQKESLESFIYEFRYKFPICVDSPNLDGKSIPITMEKYQFQGTPSLVLIDKKGFIRRHYFGVISDLELGNEIQKLILED